MTDQELMQIHERLDMASTVMSEDEFEQFCAAPETVSGKTIPKGYKLCHKCGTIKKITAFNKNKAAKDGCTSQCKECQKANARKSYGANRHKRTWKSYYEKHKEEKRELSRKYYQEHKEELNKKHAIYRNTKKGKSVMEKAHAKRAKALEQNTGIPYTREMVIDRDCQGGKEPICYLCGKPITGTPHLDHVIPVVMAGKDCFTNIACTHDSCNLKKSKDAREITAEQVEQIITLSETYMDEHKEMFPEIFGQPDLGSDADEAKC